MYQCFENAWDLENFGWPPVPSDKHLQEALDWHLNKCVALAVDPRRLKSNQILLKEGLGALGDWRSTLIFLSRLRPKQSHSGELVARSPVLSVIDAFNVFITRGKRFSMGHKMLAYLAPVMGTRLVLTTNFDNLIEQAFFAVRNELTVFNVSVAGRLPDHRVVRSQMSLIKLHGGMSETRADFSLDEEPSELDKCRFLNYVNPRLHTKDRSQKGAPACLLVIGFSGRDRRIIDFIKYVLQQTQQSAVGSLNGPAFKVFWVAYSEADSDRACEEFSNYRRNGAVHVMQTLRPDLFLFELYHDLTYCLPPGGLPFSLSHRVPPLPGLASSHHVRQWCNRRAFFNNAKSIVDSLQTQERKESVYVWKGQFGITSLASKVYWSLLDKHKKCIWLDLEDFHNVAMAETQLFKTICNRRGLLELETVTLSPVVDKRLQSANVVLDYKRLIDYLTIRPREWYIFLNGRYGLGTASGLRNYEWPSEQKGQLTKMIDRLADSGFTVIYLSFPKHGDHLSESHTSTIPNHFDPDVINLILKDTLEWLLRDDDKKSPPDSNLWQKEHFLYAILLCRQARHLSLLSSEAAFPVRRRFDHDSNIDYDRWRGDRVRKWVAELKDIGLLRFKAGGFYSLRTSLREKLLACLLDPEKAKRNPFVSDALEAIARAKKHSQHRRTLADIEARIHHWIAEWYLKAFRVTRDSMAFVECLHHRYMSLLASGHTKPPRYIMEYCTKERKMTSNETINCFRLQSARVALLESIKLLRMSRRIIKSEVELTMAEKLFGIDGTVVRRHVLDLNIDPEAGGQTWKEYVEPWLELWNRENEFLLSSIRDEAGIIFYSRLGAIEQAALAHKRLRTNSTEDSDVAGLAHDLETLLHDEDDFVLQLRKKEFRAALNHVKRKIRRCKIDADIADAICHQHVDIHQLRAYLFYWMARQREEERRALLPLLLQCFILLLEIKVQTAKISQELSELPRSKREDVIESRRRWYDVAALAGAFIRLSWHLPPEDVELQNRFHVTVRSLLGLSFAYLGRFFESHRRYEEASAFLANTTSAGESVNWGILDLRRCESLICEASYDRRRGPEAGNSIRILACLDDAWEAIERAERAFSGKSRSVWWWGRLSVLKLRIFKGLAFLDERGEFMPIADRTFPNRQDHIHQILAKGLLLNPRDILRTARMAEHYMKALPLEHARGQQFKTIRKHIEKLLHCLKKDILEVQRHRDPKDQDRNNVIAYARAVARQLDRQLRKKPGKNVADIPSSSFSVQRSQARKR